MVEMEFFDVKAKQKFTSTNYQIREKGGRYFAIAKPKESAHECWKIISKKKAEELSKGEADNGKDEQRTELESVGQKQVDEG